MKTFFKLIFLLCLLCFIPLIYPHNSLAEVNLPWSTTYDYAGWEWSSETVHPPSYPEMDRAQDKSCDGRGEQYTTAANMIAGAGGKGQRHWVGDGTNNQSGGVNVEFTATSEIWIRWYMRYELGFQWSYLNYDKILYIRTAGSGEPIVSWCQGNNFSVYAQSADALHHRCFDCGWTTVMGGSTSDGQWHYYEVHLKMDTNGSNGVCQVWIDGSLKIDESGVGWGTNAGFNYVGIGSNQATPNNGRCMAVDFDDIAISNDKYIGPISGEGSEDNTPPSVVSSPLIIIP